MKLTDDEIVKMEQATKAFLNSQNKEAQQEEQTKPCVQYIEHIDDILNRVNPTSRSEYIWVTKKEFDMLIEAAKFTFGNEPLIRYNQFLYGGFIFSAFGVVLVIKGEDLNFHPVWFEIGALIFALFLLVLCAGVVFEDVWVEHKLSKSYKVISRAEIFEYEGEFQRFVRVQELMALKQKLESKND